MKMLFSVAAAMFSLIASPVFAQLVPETKFEFAPEFSSSSLVSGPTDVYDTLNAPSAPIAAGGFASNDLGAVWGDTVTMVDTGRLRELTFTVFNSSSASGNFQTADITFSFFDASTFNPTDFSSNTPIGSFTGQLDFTGGGGMPPGAFTTPTFFELELLEIDLLITDLIVTQQLSNVVGTNRVGSIGFDTVNIGSSANSIYISASDIGADGFYTGVVPAFLGFVVNLTVVEPEPTGPFARKFLDGEEVGGLLSDVVDSDDVYYEVAPVPTANPIKQKIDLILLAESPTTTPNSFSFALEAVMTGGPSGDVIQTIELWNEQDSIWELLDTRAASTTDLRVKVDATGDLTRFIHPLTDEIIAKVKWESPVFTGATFFWSVDVDQAAWLID